MAEKYRLTVDVGEEWKDLAEELTQDGDSLADVLTRGLAIQREIMRRPDMQVGMAYDANAFDVLFENVI